MREVAIGNACEHARNGWHNETAGTRDTSLFATFRCHKSAPVECRYGPTSAQPLSGGEGEIAALSQRMMPKTVSATKAKKSDICRVVRWLQYVHGEEPRNPGGSRQIVAVQDQHAAN